MAITSINLGKIKFNWRGAWVLGVTYVKDDVVLYNGSSYVCTVGHISDTSWAANSDNFDLMVQGATVTTTAGDMQYNDGATDVRLPIGNEGQVLSVENGIPAWVDAGVNNIIYYVSPTGSDTNSGLSWGTAFATINHACSVAVGPATVRVASGVYTEQLPIKVPNFVAVIGDSIRTTIVEPDQGYQHATMWQLGDGALLNKMHFIGLTGFEPYAFDDTDLEQATVRGTYVAFDPDEPILTKSPYVIECTAKSSGGVGALVDGSVHATGIKSMVFHGYTIITDNGLGYWVKDTAKAEIVSCFTYYCHIGYATTGGGKIRALNGNNSYGTYGSLSSGYNVGESTVNGTIYGELLEYDPTTLVGTFTEGDTITGAITGTTATVLNIQSTSDRIYYKEVSGPGFQEGEEIDNGSGATVDIATGGLSGQKGFILVVTGLASEPKNGGSIEIVGDSLTYVIQSSSGWVNSSSPVVIVVTQDRTTAVADGAVTKIRYDYSQVRLTGHDFLSVGTGGVITTNYPGAPLQDSDQGNEVVEQFPGRVFYVSTDQDGNFRVGEFFKVDQATGKATLNASAFDLSGLSSLRMGSIGAQLGAQINEFSTDATLAGDSNTAVPTEHAVKSYFTQISSHTAPTVDNLYTLGTPAKRWNHLYVGPGSITLGTLTLTDNAGTLEVKTGATAANALINKISNGTSDVTVAEDSNVTIITGGSLRATVSTSGLSVEQDLQIKGGDLTTNQTTFNLLNSTATTVNFAGASTTISVGASTGTTTFNSTTASTDETTGAVVIQGGLGVGGAVFLGDNLQVTGNITFGGGANQLSATQLNVNDPMIYLAYDNVADIMDTGVLVAYDDGAHKHAGIVRDHTDNTWKFFTNLTTEPGSTVSWGDVTYSDVKMGALAVTNVTASGDVAVNGGDITSTATTFNLLNSTVTTGNLFGAGTTVGIGATTGTLTLNNPTVVGSQTTVNLWNTTSTTVNFAGAATTVSIGASTGTTTINNDANLASGKVYKVDSSEVLSKSKLTLNGSSSGTVAFQAAATAGSVTYTLPSSDGSSGYALVTDGSGTLSWAVAGATITDDTSTTTLYPAMSSSNTGNFTSAKVTSTKFTFNALTGALAVKGSFALQGSSSGAVTFQAAAAAGSVTYTLPSADGTNGYALVTNGSGTLSWAAAGATLSDDSSTTTLYPTMSTSTSGSLTTAKISSSKMTFNASSGVLTTSGGFVESSSITLKENVAPIENALEVVLQMLGVTYDRKDGSKKNEAGLIAEDLAMIADNLVMRDENGKPTGIYYSKITAYLVEAIKGLQSQISPLKEEIRKLKGE